MTFVTRFAPSPTGPLHLGHAYSAILAHDMARAAGGSFLLRLEDIDRTRARAEWEELIYDDLTWLGLTSDGPVWRQSERLDTYAQALDALWARDLLFPCTCTRRDILEALAAPQEGAPMGPDGVIYPGTCRDGSAVPWSTQVRPRDQALRLAMRRAASEACAALARNPEPGPTLGFEETGTGPDGQTGRIATTRDALEAEIGDVVLARRDMGTSYHLSVVLDDAAQGVSHVIRGQDLFEATPIHVVLQRPLGLPTPIYHHHRLIRDATGKRLAKRDDARAIRRYRDEGRTPDDIRRMVGLL